MLRTRLSAVVTLVRFKRDAMNKKPLLAARQTDMERGSAYPSGPFAAADQNENPMAAPDTANSAQRFVAVTGELMLAATSLS